VGVFVYIQVRMTRGSLAALLILSWLILSGVDVLEDLGFQHHFDGAAKSRPHRPAKPVKLANDNVELLDIDPLSFRKLPNHIDPESIAHQSFLNAYLEPRTFRTHKDRSVLLI
jgi:hypothetical protein